MRLRNPFIEQRLLQGGVANPIAITPASARRSVPQRLREATTVPSSTYSAMPICGIRRESATARLRTGTGSLWRPRLVARGRAATHGKGNPGAKVETVAYGGHFLSLDQPERLAKLIKSFD